MRLQTLKVKTPVRSQIRYDAVAVPTVDGRWPHPARPGGPPSPAMGRWLIFMRSHLQLSSACIRELPDMYQDLGPSHIWTAAVAKSGLMFANSSHLSCDEPRWQKRGCNKCPLFAHDVTAEDGYHRTVEALDAPGRQQFS